MEKCFRFFKNKLEHGKNKMRTSYPIRLARIQERLEELEHLKESKKIKEKELREAAERRRGVTQVRLQRFIGTTS